MDLLWEIALPLEIGDELKMIDLHEVNEWRRIENPHSQVLEIGFEMVARDPPDVMLFYELDKLLNGHLCKLGSLRERNYIVSKPFECLLTTPLLESLREQFSYCCAPIQRYSSSSPSRSSGTRVDIVPIAYAMFATYTNVLLSLIATDSIARDGLWPRKG